MTYFPDGEILGLNEEDIAEESLWEGDSHEFVNALIESGFVDEFEGGYILHNWDKYGGKVIQKRECDKKRMRSVREKSANGSQTIDEPSNNCSRTVREQSSNGSHYVREQSANGSRTVREQSANCSPTVPVRVDKIRIEVEKTLKAEVGVLASDDAQPPSIQPSIVQSDQSPGLLGDDFLKNFGCEDPPPNDEPEEPTFLVYPCIQGKNKTPKEFRLSESTVHRWESLPEFAAMDVRAVLRKAYEHVQVPTHRKTAPRMESWLYKTWLCRDLEKGQYPRRDGGASRGRASPESNYRYRGTEQHINSPEHKQKLIDSEVLG